jgi:glycosyltransferase involved in cell wall biosynthesis
MDSLKLSLVIPVKDKNDKKLGELLRSIENQDFPKSEMEVLLITEGTSESAKAIGIRQARGSVIGILASDNVLMEDYFLRRFWWQAEMNGSSYPLFYCHDRKDDALNRYFALMGCNDPLAFYMAKCDRLPHCDVGYQWDNRGFHIFNPSGTTIGDNGYFVKREFISATDLDNYYHIDNANEAGIPKPFPCDTLKHNTGGNIFSFFKKRYHYGLQHAFNSNRRWHLVDFHKPQDTRRLLWFIFVSLTVIQPLYLSLRGYSKVRDVAWFLHPLVCLLTLFTYALLVLSLGIKRMFPSSSAPLTVRIA